MYRKDRNSQEQNGIVWSKLLQRSSVPLLALSQIDLLIAKHIDSRKELFFTIADNRDITHYIGVDQSRLGMELQKRYFRTPQQIHKHCKRGEQLLAEINEESGKLTDLRKAYASFRKQFKEICHIFSITSWFAIEAWQDEYAPIALRISERSSDSEAALKQLYRPWKDAAIRMLHKDLADGKSAAALLEKYRFLRSWVPVWYPEVDETWIKSFGASSQRKTEIPLDIHEDEKAHVDLAPYLVFFKDWRDDLRRKHAYEWCALFERIAEKLGLETDDLGYLTLDELDKALAECEISRRVIDHRKKTPFAVTANKEGITVHDDIPEWCRSVAERIENDSLRQNIEGLAAYAGKAAGRVRIVRMFSDTKHVEEGDILVSSTTHPEYLPAMKRAAAIITESGGMISHAAIVAREIGTPCIVRAVNATKLLKDGDFIEIDGAKIRRR